MYLCVCLGDSVPLSFTVVGLRLGLQKGVGNSFTSRREINREKHNITMR